MYTYDDCFIFIILFVKCSFLYSGNLMTRSLAGLVDPSHLVRDSEYLQTLCVVVPK